LKGLEEPGLVLTPPGVATAQDDGILTASEAARLTLSADWVILSACNTAAADGTPGAESLSGLAKAFLYAGASALMVSHWQVGDDVTAALTVQTIALQRADPRLSKAQALQAAMRAVRTGLLPDGKPLPGWSPIWAHPGSWAPFVLVSAGV
jgi:CHAT domain-containing protein